MATEQQALRRRLADLLAPGQPPTAAERPYNDLSRHTARSVQFCFAIRMAGAFHIHSARRASSEEQPMLRFTRALWTAMALSLVLPAALRADDWPQWRGPERDGAWRET